jgi:hypothetical protein
MKHSRLSRGTFVRFFRWLARALAWLGGGLLDVLAGPSEFNRSMRRRARGQMDWPKKRR